MSSNLIRLHPFSFNRKCDMYGCKNTPYGGHKLYAIGVPKHLSQKPVICEHCVKAMMQNLPAEIAEIVGVSPDENTVSPELLAEKDKQIESLLAEIATLSLRLQPVGDNDNTPDHQGDVTGSEGGNEPVTITKETVTETAGDIPESTPVDASGNKDGDKNDDDEKNDGDGLFRCLECAEETTFKSKGALTRHMNKEHPEA